MPFFPIAPRFVCPFCVEALTPTSFNVRDKRLTYVHPVTSVRSKHMLGHPRFGGCKWDGQYFSFYVEDKEGVREKEREEE
jgi:hypothetical protein